MNLLSDPPPKRSAEDNLFDYLDPEELESEKSKRPDRRGVNMLTK